jgi:hypothetical protein
VHSDQRLWGQGKKAVLTSSPGLLKAWGQKHGFQLLPVCTRIIARGHLFIHQIFIGLLLCIKDPAEALVDKDE